MGFMYEARGSVLFYIILYEYRCFIYFYIFYICFSCFRNIEYFVILIFQCQRDKVLLHLSMI